MPYLIDHTTKDGLMNYLLWLPFGEVKQLVQYTIPVIIISLVKFVAKLGIEGPNCSDDHHLLRFSIFRAN